MRGFTFVAAAVGAAVAMALGCGAGNDTSLGSGGENVNTASGVLTDGAGAGTSSSRSTTATGHTTTSAGDPCGNGAIDTGEDCDGKNLGIATCALLGFSSGQLKCSSDCSFDTTHCVDVSCAHDKCTSGDALDPACDACVAAVCDNDAFCCSTTWDDNCAAEVNQYCAAGSCKVCGDGEVGNGEQCDGSNLNGASCTSLGYQQGELLCDFDCTFDLSLCTNACAHDKCAVGGTMDPACDSCVESICDGDPFCCTQSWDASCVAETNSICGEGTCSVCGDDTVQIGERCDGSNLGGASCATQGFSGGVLGCKDDCSAFDTGSCCAHDKCASGAALSASCDQCVAKVCNVDSYCCDNTWDKSCVDETSQICGANTCPNCGNDVQEGGEQCDGFDLHSASCASQGFASGSLSCTDSCEYDYSGCSFCAHDKCSSGTPLSPFCDLCALAVCANDSYCCSTSWDFSCVNETNTYCGSGTCP